jgi:hypothetical protein
MFWKASWVPEAAVRTTRSIGPDTCAPGTSLQLRTWPLKIACTVSWEMLGIAFCLLVTTQIASRAILLKTSPPGSEGWGSRDELPIVTRARETSAMPMSEPPWESRKLTLLRMPGLLR